MSRLLPRRRLLPCPDAAHLPQRKLTRARTACCLQAAEDALNRAQPTVCTHVLSIKMKYTFVAAGCGGCAEPRRGRGGRGLVAARAAAECGGGAAARRGRRLQCHAREGAGGWLGMRCFFLWLWLGVAKLGSGDGRQPPPGRTPSVRPACHSLVPATTAPCDDPPPPLPSIPPSTGRGAVGGGRRRGRGSGHVKPECGAAGGGGATAAGGAGRHRHRRRRRGRRQAKGCVPGWAAGATLAAAAHCRRLSVLLCRRCTSQGAPPPPL